MARELGFSILEFMLVAVLLGTGLLGLGGLQLASLRGRGAARARLGGLALAVSTLETAVGEARLRRLVPEVGASPGQGIGASRGGEASGVPSFETTLTRPRRGQLEVRVAWKEGEAPGGSPRAIALVRGVPD